jgi:Tol biopolymer transport system component
VAYSTYPDGLLWRSRIDGSQKLQLTSRAKGYADSPQWSPDGKQIAFVGGDNKGGLYLVSVEGGEPRSFSVADFDVFGPSWIPDGNSIIFGDYTPSTPGTIKRVDLKTLQVATIPVSKGMFTPQCSPDGRYIAVSSRDGQKLMPFDFTAQKWLELLKTNVGYVNWSTDSKYIYLDTGLGSSPAFYRVRVADRKVERVADMKGPSSPVFRMVSLERRNARWRTTSEALPHDRLACYSGQVTTDSSGCVHRVGNGKPLR